MSGAAAVQVMQARRGMSILLDQFMSD